MAFRKCVAPILLLPIVSGACEHRDFNADPSPVHSADGAVLPHMSPPPSPPADLHVSPPPSPPVVLHVSPPPSPPADLHDSQHAATPVPLPPPKPGPLVSPSPEPPPPTPIAEPSPQPTPRPLSPPKPEPTGEEALIAARHDEVLQTHAGLADLLPGLNFVGQRSTFETRHIDRHDPKKGVQSITFVSDRKADVDALVAAVVRSSPSTTLLEQGKTINGGRFFAHFGPAGFATAVANRFVDTGCTDVDYTPRFGPTRDQRRIGVCWGMAAADLLGEALFTQGKLPAGTLVSVLDFIKQRKSSDLAHATDGDTWLLGKVNLGAEGFHPRLALNKYTKAERIARRGVALQSFPQEGICREELAPFPDGNASALTSARAAFLAMNRANLDDSAVAALMSHVAIFLGSSRGNLAKIAPDRLKSIIAASATFEAFLQQVLIPAECEVENDGIKLNADTLHANEFIAHECIDALCPPQRQGFMRSQIVEQLMQGRSIGLLICAHRYSNSLGGHHLGPVSMGECGAHAIVLNAMKRAANGTCHVNLRNSWGAQPVLHGDHDLSALLPYIYGVFSLSTTP